MKEHSRSFQDHKNEPPGSTGGYTPMSDQQHKRMIFIARPNPSMQEGEADRLYSSVLSWDKIQPLLSTEPVELIRRLIKGTGCPSYIAYFACIVKTHPQDIILGALKSARQTIDFSSWSEAEMTKLIAELP